MRILTWNVNGLNACMKRGFTDILAELKPDVVCLQETKLNEEIELAIPYHLYWNFANKKGYSGTAIFCKYNPLSVKNGIDVPELDDEGRVITLEFKQFYLINVYVPNSQSSLKRFEYRDNFDLAFKSYVQQLQEVKPVVICGDFNVARDDIDVYPENVTNIKDNDGFETQERTNFTTLLDEVGLIDVFRTFNPEIIEYSWWSNRQNKRVENKGWRIDYFLTTEHLQKYILKFKHHTNIYGSDHCPLEMVIQHNLIKADQMTDEELSNEWNNTDWIKAEDDLLDMQQKLTKAVFTKNEDRIIEMQKRIVRSHSAKLLAVRHVTETSTSPGIDKVKWITPAEKMRAVYSLSSQEYKAQPCRHIVIRTKNKTKERRISLPTMYDRAMQVLYAYSLDPVSEGSGDRKSFAFRKGRSLQDVNEYIFKHLSGENAPQYVLLADVKSYYNTISHEWLLNNIPMDKYILREFLKAGFIFSGSLFPSEQGISLGANISPILANMTLDGMQEYIFENYYKDQTRDYDNGNLIRFADDVLITAKSFEDAQQFRKLLDDFLIPRGLKLSDEKTKICKTSDGFDFLSRHYQYKNTTLICTPSQGAIERFEANLKEFIFTYKGSQQSLIEALNKKLAGFATYHKISDATEAFKHIDITLNALLLENCMKKHPKLLRKTIIDKYWYRRSDGEYIYAVKDKIECQVVRLSDVFMTTHKKVRVNANPYLETEYFEEREEEKEIFNISGKYKPIWQRQKGRCYYCNQPILPDQQRSIITMNITKPPYVNNLAYIHTVCKEDDFFQKETSDYDKLFNKNDTMSLLLRLNDENTVIKSDYEPFEKLSIFFLNLETTPYTLTFSDIEKIMGIELCSSAYKYSSYWHKEGSGRISECWKNNGYIIHSLHMNTKKVIFRKEDTTILKLQIPPLFLTQKIPMDAKFELENYFEFIRKKYGL